jgi:E3 ubiquitin-protein ligase HECTD2
MRGQAELSPGDLQEPRHRTVCGSFVDPRSGPLLVLDAQPESPFSDSDPRPQPATEAQAVKCSRAESPPNHPLSALFSRRKRRSRPGRGSGAVDDSDSDSYAYKGPSAMARPPPLRTESQSRRARRQPSPSSRSGRCMTCGTLVQWPEQALVFKCSTCLGINDIRPLREQALRGLGKPASPGIGSQHPEHATENASSAAGTYNHTPGVHALAPDWTALTPSISLQHTKWLARDCLSCWLRSKVAKDEVSRGSLPFRGNSWQHQNQSFIARSHDPLQSPERPQHLGNDVSGRLRGSGGSQLLPVTDTADGARVFERLERYITDNLTFLSLNASFIKARSSVASRPTPTATRTRSNRQRSDSSTTDQPLAEVDAKLLLLGNVEENGSWWAAAGEQERPATPSASLRTEGRREPSIVSLGSPRIDWLELADWYSVVCNAAKPWRDVWQETIQAGTLGDFSEEDVARLEDKVLQAQGHVRDVLLDGVERLLRRPGGKIVEPGDLRFLLIIMANPLLRPGHATPAAGTSSKTQHSAQRDGEAIADGRRPTTDLARRPGSSSIKRILGLLCQSPEDCRRHLLSWFSHYSARQLCDTKDFIFTFLVYRLRRQLDKTPVQLPRPSDGLIPSLETSQRPALLHAALGRPIAAQRPRLPPQHQQKLVYAEDWQVRAAVVMLALVVAANDRSHHAGNTALPSPSRGRALQLSDFYITLLDQYDLVSDFERWESRSGKCFAFVQYPFLLSISAKTEILEHDARRQMHSKARDAFFDSIMTRRAVEQFLTLTVRRDCLVEDSLRAVSEVIGSGSEDVKKALRIVFKGEEGLDAGGLRKEWFLLLVREAFHPDHGECTRQI